MIQIISKQERYSYDAYHIVKMFFAEEEVKQQIDTKQEALVRVQLESGSCFCIMQEDIVTTQREMQGVHGVNQTTLILDKQSKQELNRQMYRWLQTETKRTLAWGILTGIRPTKIVCNAMKEGKSEEEIRKYLREFYYVSEEKIDLCMQVANKERALLESLNQEDTVQKTHNEECDMQEKQNCERNYSLYVGIPFCPTTCNYCSFTSYPIQEWKSRTGEYLQALCKEITFVAEKMKMKKLQTIYIGGGTPTTLTAEELEYLLLHIEKTFSKECLKEYLKEYTVEAGRADSITEMKLHVLKKYHVSRISINPQTMKQDTLDAIGRKHTVEDVVNTFHLARKMGFDNINMDLIAGLADESIVDMEETLRQVQDLKPDSLTIHALAVKRASRMNIENTQIGHIARELESMILAGEKSAKKMKMEPYYLYRQKNIAGSFENVGYAKVDKAGIYNILIMEEIQSIIAVGAGATTKVVLQQPISYGGRDTNIVRIENVKDVNEYITRIDEMIHRKEEWIWR